MTTEQPQVIPDLLQDLTRLGLQRDDLVVMHSSFRTLGRKDIAPADVIRTILEAIGPGGTLMAPTFTYSYAGFWGVRPFDPATSPGLLNGILTETLRHYPGARRSAHPTYSVAAIGRHAEALTANKATSSALGFGSSYDAAYQLGARILLLGVGNDRNSMLHYGETVAGLPYLDIPWRAFAGQTALVAADGAPIEVPLPEEYPACSLGFGVVDAYLDSRGLLRRGKVGSANSMLMNSQAMVAAVVERLKREPGWLLCDTFGCEPCTLRKRRLRELGLFYMFQRSRRRLILPFLLPQTLLYTAFTFVPIVATVALALTNWNYANPIRFIGLVNFGLILKDPSFRGAIGNSIYYVVAGGVLLFVPACLLAWCLSQPVQAKGPVRFLILAPAVISVSVAGLMWKWLYNPLAGLVGVPLRLIGLALGLAPLVSGLLRDSSTSLTAVILTDVWHSLGIWVILLMAGLERIPAEFAEAARVDGANEGQAFFLVTLPLVWEHLRILMVLWMLTAMQAFAFNFIMRSREVIATYIYSTTFDRFYWAYGMALATTVMPCLFLIVALANRLRQGEPVEY